MTDEDDRMDRARRIRQMREGENDPPDGDEEAAGDDGGDAVDESEATGSSGSGDDELEMEWGDPDQASESDADADRAAEADVDGQDDDAVSPDDEEQDGGIRAPLPETDQLEEALEGTDADSEAETVTPGVADGDDEAAETGEETRVLEFTLEGEHYCLDIEYIEEIVKEETVTRVPNTPDFVEGVVDLRGQITTILNPKVTIGKENAAAGELIVVFDEEAFDDQGHVGWVVDDVRQVSPVTEGEVDEAPMEQEHINGVIDREESEEFVIWTTPDLVLGEAT